MFDVHLNFAVNLTAYYHIFSIILISLGAMLLISFITDMQTILYEKMLYVNPVRPFTVSIFIIFFYYCGVKLL